MNTQRLNTYSQLHLSRSTNIVVAEHYTSYIRFLTTLLLKLVCMSVNIQEIQSKYWHIFRYPYFQMSVTRYFVQIVQFYKIFTFRAFILTHGKHCQKVYFKATVQNFCLFNLFSSEVVTYWLSSCVPCVLPRHTTSPFASLVNMPSLPWHTRGLLASMSDVQDLTFIISGQHTRAGAPHILSWCTRCTFL